MNVSEVAKLRLLELTHHVRNGAQLTVVEGGSDVPFTIARVFTLRSPAGTIRGMHAHRRCSQFMICPQGAVEIVCDDAVERKMFLLDRGNLGLLVPPGVWASETFRYDNSLLIVVCDRLYEADDYIHDYTEFVAWRNTKIGQSAEGP